MNFFFGILLTFSVFMETTSDHFKLVGPTAPLEADVGSDLILPCSLQPSTSAKDMTVKWSRIYETGTLVCLYGYYEDRNEKHIQSYRGRTTLFKEELQKGNISLKLSAVQPSDKGQYKCLIRSKSWHDDITVYVKVKGGKDLHAVKITMMCFCVLGVLLIAFTACIMKGKFPRKQLSPIQYSAVSYMHSDSAKAYNESKLKKCNTSERRCRRLIRVISNCKNVILAGCNLFEQSCEALATALQSENSYLKHLGLSRNGLQDSEVGELSVGMKSTYCTVEALRLAECKFGQQPCTSLQSILQAENCLLRELDLSNTKLEDSGVRLLSDRLKSSHCKLEVLRLCNCNLGKRSCQCLVSVLKSPDCTLRELDLSNNDLMDSGVKLLASGLQSSHCKLEILRLSGCLVTDEGCSSLASVLSSNPSYLRELDLTYNHPGYSGAKLLTARLEDPHCKLHTLRLEPSGRIRLRPGLKKYMFELTMDPNTLNTLLSLSEANRKVTRMEDLQPHPDHPDRFDWWEQVMCREGMTGRCYWEAEWSGNAAVAVTYRGIKRKGSSNDCRYGLNINSWSLDYYYNSFFAWHNNKRTDITVPTSGTKRVGVYLDWPAGTLSFYSISSDMRTLTHLHTFQSTFTEPLYAGFEVRADSALCV